MKKFRFQLLHQWLVQHFAPCKVADIGGGKGLLTFLLNQSGFSSVVIDPFAQVLPTKYKDLRGQQERISEQLAVPRINQSFAKEKARNFDLLIGLHAHGANLKIIEAAAEYGKSFVLLPCCVIDEPIIPQPNIDWFDSLEEYAQALGLETARFELNFSGQNVGFYAAKP